MSKFLRWFNDNNIHLNQIKVISAQYILKKYKYSQKNRKMQKIQSQSASTESNSGRIKHQTRVRLIKFVTQDKSSIKQACKFLGINYSTGKLIMKKYMKDGTITKFSHERNDLSKKTKKTIESQKSIDLPSNQIRNNRQQQSVSNQNIISYQAPFLFWIQPQYWNFSSVPASKFTENNNFAVHNSINNFCWNF